MSGSLSLERGLAVLEILKDASEPLGVREISRRVLQSPAAVQRLLNTLVERGYVDQVFETRRYRIGHAVLSLAQHVLRQDRLIALAEAELSELASHGCFNGFLGIRRGPCGVYLLGVQSNSPVVIRASPGETMPLHATALGKALLTGLSDTEVGALLGDGPLERLTQRTLTDPHKLIAQLRTARLVGYTTALNENLDGVISVGAPVRDASGAVAAAVSVAFPRSVYPEIEIAEVGQTIMAAASRISAKLGFEGAGGSKHKEPRDAA
jgi:DNA-binding IclR family transcriptional regulator